MRVSLERPRRPLGHGRTATIPSSASRSAGEITAPGSYVVEFTGRAVYTVCWQEDGIEHSDRPSEVLLTASEGGRLSQPFRLVKVASVSCENVTSTTDTPGTSETLVIPVGYNNGFITLTAAPTPSGIWPSGKPLWSGATADAQNPATAMLSTATPGTYTVTAMCGNTISIKIVVFSVDIFAETSNGIVNDGTMTSLSECMEGRQITYTAKVSEQIPINLIKTYTFYFKTASGEIWTAIVTSTDNMVYYTVQADQVANSTTERTHKFSTPIYCSATISGKKAMSASIYVDVYELWIKEFKDTETEKGWKVCVGKDISYEAISSSDCVNWNWDMEEGVPDAWNPTGGNAKSGTAMKIPYSDLSRASNSWFGDEYGEVNVSCRDAEGNFYRRYSTDMRGICIKANVFFPPDVNVEGGAPTSTKPPCWFVFWKDGNVVSGIEDFEYENLAGWGAYYSNSNKLYLRKECRGNGNHRLSINYVNGSFARFIHSEPPTKHLLHVAGTIVHENYHKFVHLNFTGIDNDSDGLPNTEESSPSNYNSVSFIASNPNVANSLNFPSYYGYEDQEVRCRIVETDAPASRDLIKDWSATNDNPLW